MAKKKKKAVSPFASFSEKQRFYIRRFDLATVLLVALIVLSAAVTWGCKYELGKPDPAGFIIWFLLFLAYLPLEIFGFVSWMTGFSQAGVDAFLSGNEALVLGACDLVVAIAFWAVVRFGLLRRYGLGALRICTIFVLIVAFWGVFQLGCSGAVIIWNRGGLAPLHQHLHRSIPPEKVIIVAPTTARNTLHR